MTTLGICIPTYKRPDFLRRCVQSAIASAEGRPLQIFIADDSASDTNAMVLTELKSTYPHSLNIHHNTRNLGIDANIQQAVELCNCDYAWLIGEDDVFLPSAIATMYDFLQQRTDPFVFSAYQYVSEDHAHLLGIVQAGTENSEMPVADFIQQQLWSIGFIGAVVIRKAAWAKTTATPYLGTYFTHVGRILEMLTNVTSVPIRHFPAVANRAQGDDTFTWKKDSFGVFLGFERMCETAAAHNPILNQCIRKAAINYRHKFSYFSIKTTFRLRAEGAYDLRQYQVYISGSPSIQTWRKLWMLILALIPSQLLKPLAWTYVIWKKRSY